MITLKSSWKFFTLFGIPVKVHWTFGFILLLIFYQSRVAGLSILGTWWLFLLFMVLFICVILHEYGHALMARRFKVNTKDIIISPIGGIARLEKIPHHPIQELLVAIAGPAVNFIIALIIWISLMSFFPGWSSVFFNDSISVDQDSFLSMVMFMNLTLGLFNLIPAFPMDGGRILRALLSLFANRLLATKIAMVVGRIIAFLFIFVGLYYSLFVMALIGAFVFIGAGAEYKSAKWDYILQHKTVDTYINREFQVVFPSTPLSIALQSDHQHFLVQNMQGSMVGIMTRNEVLKKLKENSDLVFGTSINPVVIPIQSGEKLGTALHLMQMNNIKSLPVYLADQLQGFVHYSQILKQSKI